jgi:hypothetical protein
MGFTIRVKNRDTELLDETVEHQLINSIFIAI